MRTILALITMVIVFAILFVPSSDASAGGNAVDVTYFYPRDQEPNLEYVSTIDSAMIEVQDWYDQQVGSTFSLEDVQVIRGQRTAAQYQGNIWSSVLTELGFYCGTGVHVIIAHPSIPFYGGGSCDSAYKSGSGGGTVYVYEGSSLRGGLAHELGHAFALPHPLGCGITWPDYCADTVMWSHWLYPDVGLLDIAVAPEISSLQSSPWFNGASPEPTPTCEPKYNPHGKLIGSKKCR